jgi:hypothetical protein
LLSAQLHYRFRRYRLRLEISALIKLTPPHSYGKQLVNSCRRPAQAVIPFDKIHTIPKSDVLLAGRKLEVSYATLHSFGSDFRAPDFPHELKLEKR